MPAVAIAGFVVAGGLFTFAVALTIARWFGWLP